MGYFGHVSRRSTSLNYATIHNIIEITPVLIGIGRGALTWSRVWRKLTFSFTAPQADPLQQLFEGKSDPRRAISLATAQRNWRPRESRAWLCWFAATGHEAWRVFDSSNPAIIGKIKEGTPKGTEPAEWVFNRMRLQRLKSEERKCQQ